ncbi:MAG TPA: riboflavin synthase [Actinomycetota bacterium]|nr:riboflavin synthase [Actinomycetota bacterium]
MFTGLVQQMGTVVEVHPGATTRLVIRPDRGWEPYEHGESIATSGVCLTVVDSGPDHFAVDVMAQTLQLTSLADTQPGRRVNLERAMRLGDRLGGHLVQGHVDGVATVTLRRAEPNWEVVGFDLPEDLRRYVVAQGSICLDGVSLTVSARTGTGAQVSLIPETLRATTLGDVRVGDRLNVEVDVIGKYVESLLGGYR